MAQAQTPAPLPLGTGTVTLAISADFNVAYDAGVSYAGQGTISPLGTASLSAAGDNAVSVKFTFLSGASVLVGDSFQANGAATVGGGEAAC